MSESELHAILNEIKNKGQVDEELGSKKSRDEYAKIIESFNSVTKDDALDAFSAKREEQNQEVEEKQKESFFDKIKKIFKK